MYGTSSQRQSSKPDRATQSQKLPGSARKDQGQDDGNDEEDDYGSRSGRHGQRDDCERRRKSSPSAPQPIVLNVSNNAQAAQAQAQAQAQVQQQTLSTLKTHGPRAQMVTQFVTVWADFKNLPHFTDISMKGSDTGGSRRPPLWHRR